MGAVAGCAVATAILGTSALASGGTPAAPRGVAKATSADGCARQVAGRDARAAASGSVSAHAAADQFFTAVAGLARAGTITGAQAKVLDADIQAGSIDPKRLVATGVLSAATMQAVNDRLVAVKRGLAAHGQITQRSSAAGGKAGG